jgi:hypothetical protein
MNADPGPGASLRIKPVVSYPHAMTVRERHRVDVDLEVLASPSGPWRWPDEEFAFTCMLDGGDLFSIQALHDASVVVHRFGGSYGAASFIATPSGPSGRGVLWLTIVSPRGVPVSTHEFKVDVRDPAAPRSYDTKPDSRVAAGSFPVDPVPVPTGYAEPELVMSAAAPTPPTSADVPDAGLGEGYELVALNQTRLGELKLCPIPLFPPGAVPGQHTELSIRCGPSDETGTVFPVVARPPRGRPDQFRVVSLHSAKVPPGTYQIAASLVEPGRIEFSGLPVPVRPVERSFESIIAAVPRQITAGPAHLILAIEISGPPDLVRARVAAAERLVEHAANSTEQTRFSIISYGPHAIHYPISRHAEIGPTTLADADSLQAARLAFDLLYERGGTRAGYTRAAQIECVLTDLGDSLDSRNGRPVLVTIGSRPAHPARVDRHSEIIPCRRRNSWRGAMDVLRRFPGIAFGAINESEQARQRDPMWRDLGRDAWAGLRDFPERRFAARLALPGESLPRQQFMLPLLVDGSLPPSAEPSMIGA